MPNRTLQAKELKRKKQRRLFPKQLGAGYISVGSRFNKELASVSRGRVSGRAFDEEFNRYVDAKTVKNVTASVESIAAEEAALRITEMDKTHWPLRYVHISNSIQKVTIYSSYQTCFVLVLEHFRERVVKRSITYSSKERLLSQFVSDKIRWASSAPMSSG